MVRFRSIWMAGVICSILLTFLPLTPRCFGKEIASVSKEKETIAWTRELSVPFIPNEGQYADEVAFVSPMRGHTLSVTKQGKLGYYFPQAYFSETIVTERHPAPKGMDPAPTKVSFFIGNDPSKWKKDIPTYQGILLSDVLPLIDVNIHVRRDIAEKRFIVHAGADPATIHIKLSGVDSLSLNDEGELALHIGSFSATFSKPIAYQDIQGKRVSVPVAYVLPRGDEAVYAFSVGYYNANYPLIIDPILQSTYLGGTGNEDAKSLAVHPTNGDIYVAGMTSSTNFPGTAGGGQQNPGGSGDAFVARMDASLTTLKQATYLGGSGLDQGYVLAIHPTTGDVYVTGWTQSNDFPGTSGGAQSAKGAGDDAFVARLNAGLTNLMQATYMGGDGADNPWSLAVHPTTGDVYVAGDTGSSAFPGTVGGYQENCDGSRDAFIARLNAGLTTLLQATCLGGGGYDWAASLTVHPVNGDIYVTGNTDSDGFPGSTGGAQQTRAGQYDTFVARLNPQLTSLIQATYLGGSDQEGATTIAVHPTTGDVYVAGWTVSNNFPGAVGSAQENNGGRYDGFVARVNAGLTTLLQSTYLGGGNTEAVSSIAIHPTTGDVYVAGTTDADDLPGTAGGAQENYGGGSLDGFVARYNAGLTTLKQSTYLGGNDYDYPNSIVVYPATGVIYVAGQTASGDFPDTAGGYQDFRLGQYDGFISSFDQTLRGGSIPPVLTVMKQGNGTGTVTSDLSGIDCGSDCTELYDYGTVVTLTATPDPASVFAGWLDGGCPVTGTYQLTLTEDTTITALFIDTANFPKVTMVFPNGGEILHPDVACTAIWGGPATAQSYKLFYSFDNGLTWKPITTQPINGTTWPWTIPKARKNTVTYRTKVVGYKGTTKVGADKSDKPFTIEVIKLTYPNGGEPPFLSEQDITITWTAYATIRLINQVKLLYTLDNGLTWKPFLSQPAPGSDPGSHTVKLPKVTKTKSKCKVKVVLKDAKGKKVGSDMSDGVFTIRR